MESSCNLCPNLKKVYLEGQMLNLDISFYQPQQQQSDKFYSLLCFLIGLGLEDNEYY